MRNNYKLKTSTPYCPHCGASAGERHDRRPVKRGQAGPSLTTQAFRPIPIMVFVIAGMFFVMAAYNFIVYALRPPGIP